MPSTCAPIRWEVDCSPCCDSTPFLWCLPKETVSSRQRKALFYLGGSTIRVSATASVVFTHLRPTWGGGWWVSERLPSPGANGIGYGRFARVVLLEGVTVVIRFRLAPKSAFLWGSTPFLCARAKKWGGMGSRGEGLLPGGTAHTQPRANKVPPCLCLRRVRRYVGRWFVAPAAFRPHFFGACPKKRCRAAKEKRFYYPGGSTIRVSATASVVFTHLRPTWGGAWWLTGRSSRLDAVGCDVGASSSWKRRAGPNSCRGGTHKRVSLGLHPVSLRKSKEMGWNGQGQCGLLPGGTAHTYWAQKSRR